MNVEIGTEVAQFPEKEYIDGIFIDVYTLQGKSYLCVSFLGIARPQPQFPHSCVCDRFIYPQDPSTYFPAAE